MAVVSLGFNLGENMNLERLEALIGKTKLDQIKNLNILIVGIGGVGGYTLESLVRSGVENITIIDKDIITDTNLNRQILTDTTNIGKIKVEEAVKRIKKINKSIKVTGICDFLTEKNIAKYVKDFDYIIDTCDTVSTKVALIKYANKNNIKIISCMGTAKKIDGTLLKVSTLDKTKYCPLARKIRHELTRSEQEKTKVIYSEETALKCNELGSTSYVPGIAGLLITGELIKDIINL